MLCSWSVCLLLSLVPFVVLEVVVVVEPKGAVGGGLRMNWGFRSRDASRDEPNLVVRRFKSW